MKAPNKRIFGLLAIALGVLGLGTFGLVQFRLGETPHTIRRLARVAGWLAVTLLGASLMIRPLRRSRPSLAVWRRPLGVGSGVMASVHLAATLATSLDHGWAAVLSWPYLRAGLLAFLVLTLLLLTSFAPFRSRLPGKVWKPLHRLVYLTVPLLVFHVLYAPQASATLPAVLLAGASILLLARLRKRRPSRSP